jgi:hypothetical protein
MSTDKTAFGDLKILLTIIFFASLIWGFFKVKGRATPAAGTTPSSQVNQK